MNNKVSQNDEFGVKNPTWLPTCHSTNTYVHEWLKGNDCEDGWLVYTFDQTRGRGQAGTSWESEPDKNLTFTKVYKLPFLIPKDQFLLNMAVSLGIVQFLNEMDIKAEIKWPNDIYVGRKKIAGILIENQLRGAQFRYSAIGVGLNVNQNSFNVIKATSMMLVVEKQYDLQDSLKKLCGCLDTQVSRLHIESQKIKEEYIEKLFQKNIIATYKSLVGSMVFEGILKGINDKGNLIIDTEWGPVEFGFKEIDFMI